MNNRSIPQILRCIGGMTIAAAIPIVLHFCSSSANADDSNKSARLVSLAPSNTELIYSLNAGGQLVGVSDVCDYPPEAKKKEKVGSFNSVKLEKLTKLHPDRILLITGQEALANTLKKHKLPITVLDNSTIEQIPKNLETLGAITNKNEEAQTLKDNFTKSLNDLKSILSRSKSRPRVLICVWPQPLMAAGKGSFMDQCITICGGVNCTGDLSQAYPRVNPERLLLIKPDIILVPNEVRNEKFWLKAPWKYMAAVKQNKLFVLPQYETDCLYRPTLRIKDALHWLATTIHPEFKKEIDAWYRTKSPSHPPSRI
ncbi:MAG: helical backbone metal receptor [Candidatus Obscuribacterales bacterium]|nr:helical backbone metal receptor [Candidatus Obscuribacterales bacterium]